MKKTALLITVLTAALLLCGCAAFLVTGTEPGEALGFTLYEPGSDVEGIRLEPDGYSWGTPDSPPVLAVRWVNKTDADFVYGEAFEVLYKENGQWTDAATEEHFFNLIGNVLPAGGVQRKEYSLAGFDMTRTGDYRFRVRVGEEQYVWVDFALKYAE